MNGETKINESFKYNYLIGELRKRIFSGALKAGERLPSERQLSEAFGYSRVTVRSALRQLENEGLIARRHGKGTFVRSAEERAEKTVEETLTLSETPRRICCVCAQAKVDIDVDPFYSQVFLGFHRARTKDRFAFDPVTLSRGESFVECLEKNALDLTKWAGSIFVNYRVTDREIAYLEKRGHKFVLMGEIDSCRRAPMVDMDNFAGSYMATNHLIEMGRRRVLFLCPRDDFFSRRRQAGYRAALEENGVAYRAELDLPVSTADEKSAAITVKSLVSANAAFDAVIVYGDWATVGAVDALKALGSRIPEDVAVVSYDPYAWMLMGNPKLTRVIQPFAKMAERAVELLMDPLENGDDETRIVIVKPVLQIAESTRKTS